MAQSKKSSKELLAQLQAAVAAENNEEASKLAKLLKESLMLPASKLVQLVGCSSATWTRIENPKKAQGKVHVCKLLENMMAKLAEIVSSGGLGVLSKVHIDVLAATDEQNPHVLADLIAKLAGLELHLGYPLDREAAAAFVQLELRRQNDGGE